MRNTKIHPLKVSFDHLLTHLQIGSAKKGKGPMGFIFILGVEDKNKVLSLFEKHASTWQLETLKSQMIKEVIHFSGTQGPVWILARKERKGPFSHHARLEESEYTWAREQTGALLSSTKTFGLKHLQIELQGTSSQMELGALVGLELAAYNYKNQVDGKGIADLPTLSLQKAAGTFDKNIVKEALNIGFASNLARHLVNSPPNHLNPTTLSEFVVRHFKNKKNIKVSVWNKARLEKEGMGLHLGVGQGSAHPPCMVHLKYRPPLKKKNQSKSKTQPLALVGKGVTFDTGGLDIKPSSGMRLMKKDMGGVASLVGVASWIAESQPNYPIDIYLGLAENSVDGHSMRPSDVLVARNGMSVEIHNTDAEGRLVLADVLDVAVTQAGADEPQMVINVATLTGAIKVGLGADIAGLFSNHDGLAEELNRAGTRAGELSWRMPLYSRYGMGSSNFADLINAVDGFGGAITAALFLEKFVKNKPWAHMDIYGWNDKPTGSLAFSGGNGQPVQTLIEFIKEKSAEG